MLESVICLRTTDFFTLRYSLGAVTLNLIEVNAPHTRLLFDDMVRKLITLKTFYFRPTICPVGSKKVLAIY